MPAAGQYPQDSSEYGLDPGADHPGTTHEETVFWSLESANRFSAQQQLTMLFLTYEFNDSPSMHTWVNNTAEVWGETGVCGGPQGSHTGRV